MLKITVNYLNGRTVAARYGSAGLSTGTDVEWPPHPDRLFMSMVAAWGQTGMDPAEERALLWLERQEDPFIAAGAPGQQREPVVHYVPVNDPPPRDEKGTLIPEKRRLQPRTFATIPLDDPEAHFIWPEASPAEHWAALDGLVVKITHIGHSSSLVQASASAEEDDAPAANWRPAGRFERRGLKMRVPHPGRLAALRDYYDAGQRPEASRWRRYTNVGRTPKNVPHSEFSPDLWVFEAIAKGSNPHLQDTAKLAEALRRLTMSKCPDPLPEWISGHTAERKQSKDAHIAWIPLAHVGSEHAYGRIMGFGLAIPRAVEETAPRELAECLNGLIAYDDDDEAARRVILRGAWDEIELRLLDEDEQRTRRNLQPETWTKPSSVWHSVTPVTLDRYYKGPDRDRLKAENVMANCVRMGLPRPVAVELMSVPHLKGAPPDRAFPRLARHNEKAGGGEWAHTHAKIVFDQPVQGPVIVGPGRFRGYGLCRPVGCDRPGCFSEPEATRCPVHC